MKTAAVIPARLESTRLPKKVLLPIQGRPMLWHVWRRASEAESIDQVYIATDSEEVRAAAEAWGGRVVMTSPDCPSGTMRIASALDHVPADFIINLQADEPMLEVDCLNRLVTTWRESPCDIVTLVFRIVRLDELTDPNLVKVVRAHDGRALYFSRSTIPHVRGIDSANWLKHHCFWGHIGVYGYRREVLAAMPQLPVSELENAEKLEQLRWLSAGLNVYTVEIDHRPIGVDTEADLQRVRSLMEQAHAATDSGDSRATETKQR